MALPAQATADQATAFTTAKSSQDLVGCISEGHGAARLPVWFVLKSNNGGLFSNQGARGVEQPYFIDISPSADQWQVRLGGGGADGAALRAVTSIVRRCV